MSSLSLYQCKAPECRYRVVSVIYQGGGVLSRHRTLEGANEAIRRHGRDVRRMNRHGGSYYHDCRVETWTPQGWQLVGLAD
jgi:hypothetical protein